jgi:protein-S-isoprenylcysteine O-methyltransferase Ste14
MSEANLTSARLTLWEKREDVIGGAFLIGILAGLAVVQASMVDDVLAMTRQTGFDWEIALQLLARVTTTIFTIANVALLFIRKGALQTARGIQPRLVAILGTFSLVFLGNLPSGQVPDFVAVMANVLIVVGTVVSTWFVIRLGRSFGIVAAARQLVTSGPYAYVRHPLYLAEAVSAAGFILAHWSWGAAILFAAFALLQYRRLVLEERLLCDAFPEYRAYASRVPRLVPSWR